MRVRAPLGACQSEGDRVKKFCLNLTKKTAPRGLVLALMIVVLLLLRPAAQAQQSGADATLLETP